MSRTGAVDIGAFESQGFTLMTVAASTPQNSPLGTAFSNPLALIVKANNHCEPVDGGTVTFSAPMTGATATTSPVGPVTIVNGQASVTAIANSLAGTYTVSATTARRSQPVSFSLTNSPLIPTGLGNISPNPRNTPVSSEDVTFNQPVNLTTCTSSALTLTDNGGANLITSAVTVSLVSGSTYQISGLSGLTAAEGIIRADGQRFRHSRTSTATPAPARSPPPG